MKIVTWNCHYGLTEEKARKVADWAGADIYFIQEVMENDAAKYPAIETALGREWSWYSDHMEYEKECERTGRGNNKDNHDLGIAIFSNKYTVMRSNEGLEQYRYVVLYDVCDEDGKKLFTAFHVWTKRFNMKGKASYAGIAAEAMAYYADKMEGLPFIVLGDFNFGGRVDFGGGKDRTGFDKEITDACHAVRLPEGKPPLERTRMKQKCIPTTAFTSLRSGKPPTPSWRKIAEATTIQLWRS